MHRLIPKTILGQLVAGTVVVQMLLLGCFLSYTINSQLGIASTRSRQRIVQQAKLLARLSAPGLAQQNMGQVHTLVEALRASPSIRSARVTDLNGKTLAVSEDEPDTTLNSKELEQLHPPYVSRVFPADEGEDEAIEPVVVDGKPVALVWVEPDATLVRRNPLSVIEIALFYGGFALLANLLPILLIVRTVTKPLRRLREATQQIIRDPESNAGFPLPINSWNEAGELTRSFNTMVRELDEQRSGLYETLALLDSMLGNAPIGFAFYDRKLRYVRLNQFLAEGNGLPINRHLGKTMTELYPGPLATRVEQILEQVFTTGVAVRDVEMNGELPGIPGPRSWICNYYPIHTSQDTVRWVGVVVVEITQRLQAEEALRKTEKLAAAGRLAASIAHEINNPLEAVTNLLYLIQNQPGLDPEAMEYTELAQQELSRVSAITQQTLRFYRQSTFPVVAQLTEILDSVLILHQPRIMHSGVVVERKFEEGLELFGLAGELRQLFANLIGNAIDAMNAGGRLIVRVERSHGRASDGEWKRGVRVCVADTGLGMSEETKRRIFEAFFTTKEATGTGLGLWVSAEIVQKHDGRITVRSRQGERAGTVFMVFFPDDGLRDVRGTLSNDPAKEAANA